MAWEGILPVEMPQLRTQTLSRGASGLILARQPTWMTVYSLKVDVPTKWKIGWPLMEKRDLPSPIITPRSTLILRRSHMLLSSDLQWAHSLHSPVNTGRTWSPGARSVTPSPTLSTMLRAKIVWKKRFIIKMLSISHLKRIIHYSHTKWVNWRVSGNE